MTGVVCPSCNEVIEVPDGTLWTQCTECGCGAWMRIENAKATYWAEDVFKNQDEAMQAWPLAPWNKVE